MTAGSFSAEYEYALIRYMPNAERGESANAGLVVKSDRQQIVLWNERFCPPHFLKSRTWKTQNMKKWRNFYKEELTVLLPGDENASMRLSKDYWNSLRTRCREGYVLGESSFILNNDPGKFREELSEVAKRLFSLLVQKEGLERSGFRHSVKSFIVKNHFFDKTRFRYPVQISYKLEHDGICIDLPFYQKNGINRAMWPLNVRPFLGTPSQATIERLGRMSLAENYFRSVKAEAEYIFLTSTTLPEDDVNVRIVKAKNGKVFSVESEETRQYFSEVCDPLSSSLIS